MVSRDIKGHYFSIICSFLATKKYFRKYLSCSSFIRAVVWEVGKKSQKAYKTIKMETLQRYLGWRSSPFRLPPPERELPGGSSHGRTVTTEHSLAVLNYRQSSITIDLCVRFHVGEVHKM